MYQNLRQAGANSTEQTQLPTGLQVGLGMRAGRDGAQLQPGQPAADQQPLDVAIKGNGFFQIQMPDGTTGYTRDGSFQVDAQRASSSPTTATRCSPASRSRPTRRA